MKASMLKFFATCVGAACLAFTAPALARDWWEPYDYYESGYDYDYDDDWFYDYYDYGIDNYDTDDAYDYYTDYDADTDMFDWEEDGVLE